MSLFFKYFLGFAVLSICMTRPLHAQEAEATADLETTLDSDPKAAGELPVEQEEPAAKSQTETVPEPPPTPLPTVTKTDYPEESRFQVFYGGSIGGLPVPWKHGPHIAGRLSDRWFAEGQYLKGGASLRYTGLKLARFEERLVLAHARFFTGRSFNLIVGLGERTYDLTVRNPVRGPTALLFGEDQEVVQAKNLMFEGGIGNYWQWRKGFSLGVDWFSFYLPISKTYVSSDTIDLIRDEETRKATNSFMRFLGRVPTFSFLTVRMGWTFR